MTKCVKLAVIIVFCTVLFLSIFFTIGRYAWKLGGFSACESAGIEQVNVEENCVRICGFYPGSFPTGFLGYHAEQIDSTLYVGFKFSALFGIFETSDFDVVIPTKGTVTQVVVKGGGREQTIWPQGEKLTASVQEATENGIYVRTERSDVYSVGWSLEDKSGGITNADGTALETGMSIYLDNDVYYTASNLERPISVELTFSDRDGATLAQVDVTYDPKQPVMTVNLTADAKVYVDGKEVEEYHTSQ